jgi:hypothetical protein
MAISFPDPDTFGEYRIRPSDKIDEEDYHSLQEWEE